MLDIALTGTNPCMRFTMTCYSKGFISAPSAQGIDLCAMNGKAAIAVHSGRLSTMQCRGSRPKRPTKPGRGT